VVSTKEEKDPYHVGEVGKDWTELHQCLKDDLEGCIVSTARQANAAGSRTTIALHRLRAFGYEELGGAQRADRDVGGQC
jgi:hypothetical protein